MQHVVATLIQFILSASGAPARRRLWPGPKTATPCTTWPDPVTEGLMYWESARADPTPRII